MSRDLPNRAVPGVSGLDRSRVVSRPVHRLSCFCRYLRKPVFGENAHTARIQEETLMSTKFFLRTLLVALVGALSLLVAGCSAVDEEPPDAAAPDADVEPEPDAAADTEDGDDVEGDLPELRIGVTLPFTGPVAESARESQEAFLMYIEEQGGTLGGLPVDVIFEDTETEAEMVVTRARKLIDTDDVHLLSGGMLAFEPIAMADTVARAEIAMVMHSSAAENFLRIDNPYILSVSQTPSQETMPLGEYAYEEWGYRRVAILGQDYEWGWQTTGGFQYGFENAGGEVVQKLWAPLGTTDYAPFVTQLERDVDAIFATVVGADVPRFVQAYNDFGLKDEIPLIGSQDLVADDAIRYYGDEALGIVAGTPFSPNIDRPEMQQFVDAYRERTGNTPTFWGGYSYNAATTIDHILWHLREEEGIPPEELPEYVRTNPIEFVETVQEIELTDAPNSDVRWDEYNWPVRDWYLVELVPGDDGTITHDILNTFSEVRFHWTFSPEDFLAEPMFSRDFPPVNGD